MILIFASHNGAGRSLSRMLSALETLRAPSDGLNILAIDSASYDDTGAVLRKAAEKLPITVLRVDQTGKNLALNAALGASQSQLHAHQLVVFTDDDVVAHPDWLIELEDAARVAPHADLFGGTIEPIFPSPPGADLMRLSDRFDVLFAKSSLPSGPCPPRQIFGPNMAVRARVLAKGVKFDEQIGPNGTSHYAMGSESELVHRLERSGAQAWFAQKACVGHLIREDQMQIDFAYLRAFRHGAGVARLQPLGRLAIFGAPVRILAKKAIALLRARLGQMRVPGYCSVRARYDAAWCRGAISMRRSMARGSPTISGLAYGGADRG
jgi:glycosyltransferase involved in cell wall biosynthesis